MHIDREGTQTEAPSQLLRAALRELHARAGSPSTREIARGIGSVSHTTVAEALSGKRVPSWPVVRGIIDHLGGDEETFRGLWLAATEPPSAEDELDRVEQDFLARYRRHAALHHGGLEPPDFERRRRVPVADIYVEPTIIPPGASGTASDRSVISLHQFDDSIGRTVLLGNPGSGKTVACNVLMYWHASEPGRLVPFLVTLRDFANTGTLVRSVIGFIEHQLETFYQCPPPSGLIERLMFDGKALIIFDGLDELLDIMLRTEVASVIELFCADFPNSPVLVTSRAVGYGQAELDPRQFTVYHIAEFDQEQVEEYVNNWFAQEGGIAAEEAATWASDFIEESFIVPDVRSNPLMLALMCVVYRGEGSLPRSRAELYEACTSLLFQKWDARRRIQPDLRAGRLIQPVLRNLAWWLFTRDSANHTVSERELLAEITMFLRDSGLELESDAKEAASEIIAFARGRMWVFSDVGPSATGEPLYAFTHRTFLEYLAAAHLAQSSDSPEQLAAALIPAITRQEWEVVAELAVLIKDRSTTRGLERVLNALLERDRQPSEYGDILYFGIRFIRSGYMPPNLVRELAGHVFTYARDDLSSVTAAGPLAWLLISKQPAREIIADEFDNKISALIQSQVEDDRLAGIRMVVKIPYIRRIDKAVSTSRTNNETFWSTWSSRILARYQDEVGPYLHLTENLAVSTWPGVEGEAAAAIGNRLGLDGAREMIRSVSMDTGVAMLLAMPKDQATQILASYPDLVSGELLQGIATEDPETARAILRRLTATSGGRVIGYLGLDSAAAVLAPMPISEIARILSRANVRVVAGVIMNLPIGVSAWLIKTMESKRTANVLTYVRPAFLEALLNVDPSLSRNLREVQPEA